MNRLNIKNQRGFARTEILLVVAVVVLLGAVIVPIVDVDQVKNPGIKSARRAEAEHIGTAMQAMMAVNAVTSVAAHDATSNSIATNSWSRLPTGGIDVTTLEDYLASATTTYYYCYARDGTISQQFGSASDCTLPERG